MKHLTLPLALLAAASFGAGCGHCDPEELDAYWTFTNGAGQSTTSCQAAGVATLHVFIDGQPFPDYATGSYDLRCADYDAAGGLAIAIRSGRHDIQIDAFDANGALVYQAARAANAVNVKSCGPTAVDVNVQAVSGALTLRLSGFTQCPANNTGFVWYSLTDLNSNTQVDVVNGLNHPTDLPCGGSVPLLTGLPFGNYRIDYVEVVNLQNNAYVPLYANCTPQQFAHSADDAVPITLVPTNAFCPGT